MSLEELNQVLEKNKAKHQVMLLDFASLGGSQGLSQQLVDKLSELGL